MKEKRNKEPHTQIPTVEKPKRLKPSGKVSGHFTLILACLFVIAGIGIFSYPAVSNYFAEKNQAKVIQSHNNTVNSAAQEEIQKQWEEAEKYNENLNGDPVHDPFVPGSGYVLPENYQSVLNLDEVMCSLEIPKIDLYLPVYHGTSEEVLEKGVGHLESTALPIGGESRHCVLTGHRGLPSAELFTRLDELEIGDQFYIHVLDEIHAYQVYAIETIEPDDLAKLVPEEGKDLVTLVTCTPYGVNSHRLLIQGERVPYVPEVREAEQEKSGGWNWQRNWPYYLAGIATGAGIISVCLVVLVKKRRKKGKLHES